MTSAFFPKHIELYALDSSPLQFSHLYQFVTPYNYLCLVGGSGSATSVHNMWRYWHGSVLLVAQNTVVVTQF